MLNLQNWSKYMFSKIKKMYGKCIMELAINDCIYMYIEWFNVHCIYGTVYCYFRPSTLANTFALSGILTDTVVFKEG